MCKVYYKLNWMNVNWNIFDINWATLIGEAGMETDLMTRICICSAWTKSWFMIYGKLSKDLALNIEHHMYSWPVRRQSSRAAQYDKIVFEGVNPFRYNCPGVIRWNTEYEGNCFRFIDLMVALGHDKTYTFGLNKHKLLPWGHYFWL